MADSSKRHARKIPEATVARLPLYLRSLVGIADDGDPTISSERLAELSGFNAAQVRKDLSYLGSYGTRGVGYDVEYRTNGPSSPSVSATWARHWPTTADSVSGASPSRRWSMPTPGWSAR
jgi:hypothetical protein